MTIINVFTLAFSLAAATTGLEKFVVPHWISLVPEKIEDQLADWQKSAKAKTAQTCIKEREEFWDLQMKASELAEKGVANEQYVEAADKATNAARKEAECRSAAMGSDPIRYELDLFAEPNPKSKKVGRLIIEVRPWFEEAEDSGDAQVVTYFENIEKKTSAFTVDVPSPFEGKPGAFHTVLAKKGSWFQLPARPFPTNVWLDLASFNAVPLSILKLSRPIFVQKGETGTYAVFQRQKGSKLVGLETMEDRSRAPKDAKPVEVNLPDLFDANGHIRAKWRADESD